MCALRSSKAFDPVRRSSHSFSYKHKLSLILSLYCANLIIQSSVLSSYQASNTFSYAQTPFIICITQKSISMFYLIEYSHIPFYWTRNWSQLWVWELSYYKDILRAQKRCPRAFASCTRKLWGVRRSGRPRREFLQRSGTPGKIRTQKRSGVSSIKIRLEIIRV